MSSISIRTARLDDLDALTEVFRAASLSNEGDREQLLAHPEFLELHDVAIVERRLRLAEIDGLTVGFVTTLPLGIEVELEDLFVHPGWMRRGVATLLIADVVERCRAAGASRVVVTANPHAMAFYLRVGFRGSSQVETDFEPGTRMSLPVRDDATMASETPIADLRRDGIDGVVAMLARSFDDDPVWCHIFSDPGSRPRRLRRMFATLAASHLRCGDRVRVAGDADAAALWGPPGHPHFSGRETLAQLPGMFRAFGPRGLRFLPELRAIDELAARWKDHPHWYLGVLGVDPSRQRSGLGSALIADTLDRVDAQGLGAYLLSSKEENIAFYGRHGFDVVSTHTFRDGPTAWGMWRESRG